MEIYTCLQSSVSYKFVSRVANQHVECNIRCLFPLVRSTCTFGLFITLTLLKYCDHFGLWTSVLKINKRRRIEPVAIETPYKTLFITGSKCKNAPEVTPHKSPFCYYSYFNVYLCTWRNYIFTSADRSFARAGASGTVHISRPSIVSGGLSKCISKRSVSRTYHVKRPVGNICVKTARLRGDGKIAYVTIRMPAGRVHRTSR